MWVLNNSLSKRMNFIYKEKPWRTRSQYINFFSFKINFLLYSWNFACLKFPVEVSLIHYLWFSTFIPGGTRARDARDGIQVGRVQRPTCCAMPPSGPQKFTFNENLFLQLLLSTRGLQYFSHKWGRENLTIKITRTEKNLSDFIYLYTNTVLSVTSTLIVVKDT